MAFETLLVERERDGMLVVVTFDQSKARRDGRGRLASASWTRCA